MQYKKESSVVHWTLYEAEGVKELEMKKKKLNNKNNGNPLVHLN